jgi:hypothetical protein
VAARDPLAGRRRRRAGGTDPGAPTIAARDSQPFGGDGWQSIFASAPIAARASWPPSARRWGAARVNIDGFGAVAGDGVGFVHVLVDVTDPARRALEAAGFRAVSERAAMVLPGVEDRPGYLGELARRLANAGVTIEVAYLATNTRVVFSVDDIDAARQALQTRGRRRGLDGPSTVDPSDRGQPISAGDQARRGRRPARSPATHGHPPRPTTGGPRSPGHSSTLAAGSPDRRPGGRS